MVALLGNETSASFLFARNAEVLLPPFPWVIRELPYPTVTADPCHKTCVSGALGHQIVPRLMRWNISRCVQSASPKATTDVACSVGERCRNKWLKPFRPRPPHYAAVGGETFDLGIVPVYQLMMLAMVRRSLACLLTLVSLGCAFLRTCSMWRGLCCSQPLSRCSSHSAISLNASRWRLSQNRTIFVTILVIDVCHEACWRHLSTTKPSCREV